MCQCKRMVLVNCPKAVDEVGMLCSFSLAQGVWRRTGKERAQHHCTEAGTVNITDNTPARYHTDAGQSNRINPRPASRNAPALPRPSLVKVSPITASPVPRTIKNYQITYDNITILSKIAWHGTLGINGRLAEDPRPRYCARTCVSGYYKAHVAAKYFVVDSSQQESLGGSFLDYK